MRIRKRGGRTSSILRFCQQGTIKQTGNILGLKNAGCRQIPENTILASVTAASTNLAVVQTEIAARQFDVEPIPHAELYSPSSQTE